MNDASNLHPELSRPDIRPHPTDPEQYLLDASGCIRIAKIGGTPQARRLYRLVVAELRKLEGSPLNQKEREWIAFKAAGEAMGWNFNISHN